MAGHALAFASGAMARAACRDIDTAKMYHPAQAGWALCADREIRLGAQISKDGRFRIINDLAGHRASQKALMLPA